MRRATMFKYFMCGPLHSVCLSETNSFLPHSSRGKTERYRRQKSSHHLLLTCLTPPCPPSHGGVLFGGGTQLNHSLTNSFTHLTHSHPPSRT